MPLFSPNMVIPADIDPSVLMVNVKDAPFNAKGDGLTDDTKAIQAAIDSLTSGGVVWFPAGTYMSNSLDLHVDGTHLLGSGKVATIIKKIGNCDLIDMSGTATGDANHLHYCSIRSIRLHGNAKTGKLIRLYYCDNHFFDSVAITNNLDTGVESTEFWDSYFMNCNFENCGDTGGTTPAVYLASSIASSGFGFSTDSTNMIWFVNCRFEAFYAGALWVRAVNGGSDMTGFFLVNCKMETGNVCDSFIKIDSVVKSLTIENLYISGGGFASGFSTPVAVIKFFGVSGCSLNNIFVSASTSVFASIVELWTAGSGNSIRNITNVGTAPTIATINFTGGNSNSLDMSNIYNGVGTAFANNTGSTKIYPFTSVVNKQDNPAFATPYTPDLLNKGDSVFISPVTGAMTLNAPAMAWTGAKLTFILTSNATGNFALTWNAVYKASQTALPTTMPGPNLTIVVTFVSDGTNWYRVS